MGLFLLCCFSGGFPTYGQAKPMGNYGQAVTGPGISSNPFMVCCSLAKNEYRKEFYMLLCHLMVSHVLFLGFFFIHN